MKKNLIILSVVAILSSTSIFAQTFKEEFEGNSLGWTESAGDSNNGTAVIDKGVMTIKSKGINKFATAMLGAQVGENTTFETHCYAPLNVKKPFEILSNVKIDKLGTDKNCGFIFNYRDFGNFYTFTFNDEMVNFLRFVDNKLVGSISQGVKWPKKNKLNQVWKLVSDGSTLSFYVNDMEILKVRYMPLDFTGVGFYTFGKQTLIVDDITFTQQ